MKSLNDLLEQAEERWRKEISSSHPLWSTIPVIKEGKHGHESDWEFSTDSKQIFAFIHNDESLRKKFTEVVSKYWDGKPEEVALDTLHYLLYHELYHPLEAPRSEDDKKKIHQAIRRGIITAEPALTALEQVLDVTALQNAVKDFILDNRFAVDNEEKKYVRDDIIPVWDVLVLHGQPTKTDIFTITGYIYSRLYGPAKTHSFFAEKTGEKGVSAAEEAMKALLKHGPESSLLGKADSIFSTSDYFEQKEKLVKEVRETFAGEDRYAAIERFMAVLSPYIEKGVSKENCQYHGEGRGSSSQDVLPDLLEDMTRPEQQQFLDQLAAQLGSKNDQSSMGRPDSTASWNVSKDELNNLEVSALHESYQRNHPKVKIVGGAKKAESVVVGKDEKFVVKNSKVLTEEQLGRLNLTRIARFQQRTRLPTLIPLPGGLYRLNEYGIQERQRRSTEYVDQSLDLSDIYEFYVDSSGSMFNGTGGQFKVDDGSSWDMSSSVLYGYIDALYQASIELRKPTKVQIHNVATQQLSSAEIDVRDFWEKANSDVLKVLFRPENGYEVEDLDIKMHHDGKQRTYVVVTDGNLCIVGRAERESKKMKQLAEQPNTPVILFEIGGSYALGKAVKDDKNIHYFPVYDKAKMFQSGVEVLLRK